MKEFPQAMALASIHRGTMTGKLNGVIPATTPTGWSTVCTSTPADTSVEWAPLSRWGMAQANSTFSNPPRHLARSVAEDLAVLGGDQGRELGSMTIDELTEAEQRRRPTAQ